MKTLDTYPLAELKLIYQLLHQQLPQQPALMDSALLHELQSHLQQQAGADGVDVSLHTDWATWLANQGH